VVGALNDKCCFENSQLELERQSQNLEQKLGIDWKSPGEEKFNNIYKLKEILRRINKEVRRTPTTIVIY
jgi:hypothetical protein